MIPAPNNIHITRNASFIQEYHLYDGTGAEMNMNGYEIYAQVWTANKVRKLADFTIQWVDKSTGKFILYLSAEDTNNVTSVGFWDLLVVSPGGTSDYWIRGKTVLTAGYTVHG